MQGGFQGCAGDGSYRSYGSSGREPSNTEVLQCFRNVSCRLLVGSLARRALS